MIKIYSPTTLVVRNAPMHHRKDIKCTCVTEHAALPQVHQVLDLNTDTNVRMNLTIL